MDDEPKVKQLENRIDKLESTIEKMMPSRRDALKMGGAALAGGSLMAGTASADTVDDQVGTIGGPGEEVDLVSEDIENSNQITTQDLVVNGTATGPFGSTTQLGTPTNVLDSRSFDTTFQNTQGNDIHVFVQFQGDGFSPAYVSQNSGDMGNTDFRVDAAASDTSAGDLKNGMLSFTVPDGHFYVVEAKGSLTNSSLSIWNEREILR